MGVGTKIRLANAGGGSTAGRRRAMANIEKFSTEGLVFASLLEDGSGTTVANLVPGGSDAAIDSVVSSDNAYSWLGGGGLRLEGAQRILLPVITITEPWTLVVFSAIAGSVKTNPIMGIFGTDNYGVNWRGAMSWAAGLSNWNTPGVSGVTYAHRTSNGAGGQLTAEFLTPTSGLFEIQQLREREFAYDGSAVLRSTMRSTAAATIATDTFTTSDANLSTGSGSVVDTTIQPTIGVSNATYAGGKHDVFAIALWQRALLDSDRTLYREKLAEIAAP